MAGTDIPIDFYYNLEEIVNMDGMGSVSLKSALRRMAGPGQAGDVRFPGVDTLRIALASCPCFTEMSANTPYFQRRAN
jgi:hypothetical protein